MNAMRFVGAALLAGFAGPVTALADVGTRGGGASPASVDEDALKAAQALDWAACVKVFEARAPKENDEANRNLWSECLARLKRWDDAAKALAPLSERDETKARTLVRIGLIELARDKVDDASPFFSRVIDKNANDALAQYGFGEVHYRRYRQGVQVSRLKAQEAFRAYLEHSANWRDDARRDEVRKKMLILDYEKEGEATAVAEDLVLKGTVESLVEAKAKLDAVIAANPDIEWAQFWLGEIHYAPAAGKEAGALFDSSDDKALAAYKKAPKIARALLRVGEIEARRGKWKEAEEAFAEAALIDKRMQAALNWLGRINAQKGDMEKAKSYWKDSMAVNDHNEYAYYAHVYSRMADAVTGAATSFTQLASDEFAAKVLAFGAECTDPGTGRKLRVEGIQRERGRQNPFDVVVALEAAIAKRGDRIRSTNGVLQDANCLSAYKQEIVAVRRFGHEVRLAKERLGAKKYQAAAAELEALLPYAVGDGEVRSLCGVAYAMSAIEKWGGAEWRVSGFMRFKPAGDAGAKPDEKEIGKARLAIGTAVMADKSFATGVMLMGLLAWIDGDMKAARQSFDALAEVQPKSPQVLNNAAVAKLQGADLKLIEPPPTKKKGKKKAPELPTVAKDAIAAFTAAAKLDRKYADPQFNLGRLYSLLGDTKKAVAAYKAYLKLGAGDDESWRAQATSAIDAAKQPATKTPPVRKTVKKAVKKKKGGA